MKNSAKVLVVILMVFSSLTYSQTFGIRGGLNISNMVIEGENLDLKDLYGFHIGGTFDYPFSEFLSLETGLFLDTKGFTLEESIYDNSKVRMSAVLFYLDLPVTIKGTYDLNSNGFKIYGLAGPYIGYGLTGKLVYEYGDEEEVEDVVWGDGEDAMFKRFDYGLTFGGGVEIKSIEIGVSYDLGLANVASNTDDEVSGKHRVLKFSLGYRFGN
ncbi:MAG: porin family protein [Bacteroidota bacterium]